MTKEEKRPMDKIIDSVVEGAVYGLVSGVIIAIAMVFLDMTQYIVSVVVFFMLLGIIGDGGITAYEEYKKWRGTDGKKE